MNIFCLLGKHSLIYLNNKDALLVCVDCGKVKFDYINHEKDQFSKAISGTERRSLKLIKGEKDDKR